MYANVNCSRSCINKIIFQKQIWQNTLWYIYATIKYHTSQYFSIWGNDNTKWKKLAYRAI